MDLPTFNVLSLCSGGGGLERGVGLAIGNARVVCCVEHEAYAIEVLASQMENGYLDDAPIWTDLRSFDGKPWRGVVDCIVGGYPCQPFSVAGKRAGTDDPRHLWPHIARIVAEVEPELCFFENVPGHLALGFDEVRDSLTEMGYRVAAGLFSAEEVGAPHKRERLFILADRNGYEPSAIGAREGREPTRYDRRYDATWGGRTVENSARLGRRGRDHGDSGGCGRTLQIEGHGGSVADASHTNWRPGINGIENQDAGTQRGRGFSGDCRPFPPSPNDTEGWMRLLETDPSLEPALCVCAHGMADRADQLRVLGNGVVPLQAAYAFLSLYACLRGSE